MRSDATVAAIKEEARSVTAVANDLLSQHRDIEKAINCLVEYILANDEIREDYIRRGLRHWARMYLQVIRARPRAALFAEEGDNDTVRGVVVRPIGSLIAATELSLLDFPLPISGKALGKASRREVVTAAGAYASRAADMLIKQNWLSLIAAALPDDNVLVEDRLNHDQLNALKVQARAKVGAAA